MDLAGEALGLPGSGHGGCSERGGRQEVRQPEAARGRLRRPAWLGPAQQASFLLEAAGPSGIFHSLVANIVANIVANSQTLFFA